MDHGTHTQVLASKAFSQPDGLRELFFGRLRPGVVQKYARVLSFSCLDKIRGDRLDQDLYIMIPLFPVGSDFDSD